MAIGFSAGSFERISEGLYRIDFSQGFTLSRLATGLEKLAIEVLFFLWTSEGSVYDDPECGTKFQSYIGTLAIGADTTQVAALLADDVMRAENQIKTRQARVALPPAEQLKRIVLDAVEVDKITGTANLKILIINALDQAVGVEIATQV